MDAAARDKLILHNLPLAGWTARRSSLEFDDAFQEAALAMLLAAEKFKGRSDDSRHFAGYATTVIRNRLAEAHYETGYPVRLPPTAAKCVPQIRRELASGEIDAAYWDGRRAGRRVESLRQRGIAALRIMDAGRVTFEEWERVACGIDDGSH